MDVDASASCSNETESSEREISSDHPSCENYKDQTGQEEFEGISTVERFDDCSEESRNSPLDLRASKLPNLIEFPRPVIQRNTNRKDLISFAELLETFYFDENINNHNPSSKLFSRNDSSFNRFETIGCTENQDETSIAVDYSQQKSEHSELKYECYESAYNTLNYWNIGTNTDMILQVDKETQTQIKETNDMTVQTDLEPKIKSYTMTKIMQNPNFKYSCSFCQRLYASKSGYDRHLRTHQTLYPNNKNIMTNIRFTTEARLQICNKQVTRKCQPEPIIIQMPRTSNIQCDACKQLFATKKEKDDHFEDCIIEPFVMNKCPHCSIKFYTLECLNRHISLIHNKPSNTSKAAYYCIFCNERFDAAFTFQLHLDKHLSP